MKEKAIFPPSSHSCPVTDGSGAHDHSVRPGQSLRPLLHKSSDCGLTTYFARRNEDFHLSDEQVHEFFTEQSRPTLKHLIRVGTYRNVFFLVGYNADHEGLKCYIIGDIPFEGGGQRCDVVGDFSATAC